MNQNLKTTSTSKRAYFSGYTKAQIIKNIHFSMILKSKKGTEEDKDISNYLGEKICYTFKLLFISVLNANIKEAEEILKELSEEILYKLPNTEHTDCLLSCMNMRLHTTTEKYIFFKDITLLQFATILGQQDMIQLLLEHGADPKQDNCTVKIFNSKGQKSIYCGYSAISLANELCNSNLQGSKHSRYAEDISSALKGIEKLFSRNPGALLIFQKNKDQHETYMFSTGSLNIRKLFLCLMRGDTGEFQKMLSAIYEKLPSTETKRFHRVINSRLHVKNINTYPYSICQDMTLLHCAIISGDKNMIRLLLNCGADIAQSFQLFKVSTSNEDREYSNFSAITIAFTMKKFDVLSILCKKPSSDYVPEVAGIDYHKDIFTAIGCEKKQVLQNIHESVILYPSRKTSVDINFDKEKTIKKLFLAVRKGDIDQTKKIFASLQDFCIRNNNVISDFTNIKLCISLYPLIKKDSIVYKSLYRQFFEITLMQYALTMDNKQMIELLMSFGVAEGTIHPDLIDLINDEAENMAVQNIENSVIVYPEHTQLIDIKFSVQKIMKRLFLAAMNGNIEKLEDILSGLQDLCHCIKYRCISDFTNAKLHFTSAYRPVHDLTLLQCAKILKNQDMVQLLLNHGADLTQLNNPTKTEEETHFVFDNSAVYESSNTLVDGQDDHSKHQRDFFLATGFEKEKIHNALRPNFLSPNISYFIRNICLDIKQLFLTVMEGNLEKIQKVLSDAHKKLDKNNRYSFNEYINMKYDIEIYNNSYQNITPLQYATILNNKEVVRLLLKHGGDPDKSDCYVINLNSKRKVPSKSCSAISLAGKMRHKELMDIFRNHTRGYHKELIDIFRKHARNALCNHKIFTAIMEGNNTIFDSEKEEIFDDELVNKIIEIATMVGLNNLQGTQEKLLELKQYLTVRNNIAHLYKYINARFSVQSDGNSQVITLIHYATISENKEMIKLLLKWGADPQQSNCCITIIDPKDQRISYTECSAIFIAIAMHNLDIFKILCEDSQYKVTENDIRSEHIVVKPSGIKEGAIQQYISVRHILPPNVHFDTLKGTITIHLLQEEQQKDIITINLPKEQQISRYLQQVDICEPFHDISHTSYTYK